MKARIVVIEDNQANLELITYLLNKHGYTTFYALNGEEGLALIKQEMPILVLSDVQLPKLTGYEIAQQLKSDPQYSGIPLIALTAYSMIGDKDEILAEGFDGYISKPIDPEKFIEQVEMFMKLTQKKNTI